MNEKVLRECIQSLIDREKRAAMILHCCNNPLLINLVRDVYGEMDIPKLEQWLESLQDSDGLVRKAPDES
jgi:hypothetical protein